MDLAVDFGSFQLYVCLAFDLEGCAVASKCRCHMHIEVILLNLSFLFDYRTF